MKALLVNPPTGRYMRSDRCQAPVDTRIAEPPRPPMDLAYMAAVLERAGWNCMLKDYPMEQQRWHCVENDIKNFQPEIIVISTTTPTINIDLTLCELAKKINPAILTVAKGAHFLVYDMDILRAFPKLDIVIRGETEGPIEELARGEKYEFIRGITFRRNEDIIQTQNREFINNLDSLAFPARHLVNNNLYRTPDTNEPIAFVTTSRGCPSRCVFCAAGIVGGHTIRQRSPESTIDEIQNCIRRFAITNFFFAADTFTWDKQWVIDFCRQIIEKNLSIRWGTNSRVDTIDAERLSWMKKSGCYVIGFGAESASPRMLEHMQKGITVPQIEKAVTLCKKSNIKSYLHFLIGLPWETHETIKDTINFVKQTTASFLEVNIAYPLPGTQFYTLAKKENLFSEKDLAEHNHTIAMINTFTLTTDELTAARKKILAAFYLRPRYAIMTFKELYSWRIAYRYLLYGLRLITNLIRT